MKFDDYFEFPRNLDVQAYMAETFNKAKPDLPSINEAVANQNQIDDQFYTYETKSDNIDEKHEIIYDLVGIIVHSGQANAGHYYSFIKAVNADDANGVDDGCHDKWYKFNDTTVEEIDFNNSVLIEECFGGSFACSNDNKSLPEERVRYWNAYMLLYKVRNDVDSLPAISTTIKPYTSGKSRYITRKEASHANKFAHDSLSELAELVSRGDEKGLFNTCLPPSIEQLVRNENLEFCKNKEVYNNGYFQFVLNMAKLFKSNQDADDFDSYCVNCAQLGLEFLFNTMFKTGKKLRVDLSKWLELFVELLTVSKDASFSTLTYILDHEVNSNFIRYFETSIFFLLLFLPGFSQLYAKKKRETTFFIWFPLCGFERGKNLRVLVTWFSQSSGFST